jgi:hypothetical protein
MEEEAMADDRLQRALDRAEGRSWPSTAEARLAFAIGDRRVLAAEVRRLQALMKAKGVRDGSDRDPA